MTMQTAAAKNAAASGYAGKALYAALTTSAPGATSGTEVSGGTYARVAISWSAPASGVITASVTHNVPAGTTVVGVEYFDAATGGNYVDGFTVTSNTFGSAGTLTSNLTETFS